MFGYSDGDIYRPGDRFRLSDDAIINYGDKYKDRVFIVSGRYQKGEHPGFDSGAGYKYIYEADELPFAVYEWEMIPV